MKTVEGVTRRTRQTSGNLVWSKDKDNAQEDVVSSLFEPHFDSFA